MSMPPWPDILPMGMQWRGQTKVEPGYLSPDLASVFSVLQFGKEVRDCGNTKGLISKHLSFTLKLRCAPRRTEWCFTEKSRLGRPTRADSLVQTTPKSYETTNGRGKPWRCEIVLTEDQPNQCSHRKTGSSR